jgi:hypothetical protein
MNNIGLKDIIIEGSFLYSPTIIKKPFYFPSGKILLIQWIPSEFK